MSTETERKEDKAMTNTEDARRAHELLDELDARAELSQEQEKLLRSFLPELPKQKTLEEILEEVESAACSMMDSYWSQSLNPQDWLWELHAQLKGLKNTPAAVPALPAGMRIAEHENFGRVVVSPEVGIDKCHEIFYLDPGMASGTDISEVEPDSLTFIDAEPAHPEFLETEADYAAAPEGTIVACEDSPPWHKFDSAWLSTAAYEGNSAKGMTGIIRRVLRWG